jgi:acetylornithine deacetylase/succinyl-diaminopimelate desuccinylase-like protein
VEKETPEHFQAIVRMNTTNPPGNETPVAEYLKQVLERGRNLYPFAGSGPKRANLVAASGETGQTAHPGDGHTDVVDVSGKMVVDPARPQRRLYLGAGTGDDKDNVTAGLMLLLLLKRQGVNSTAMFFSPGRRRV